MIWKLMMAAILITLCLLVQADEEYFGEFSGEPSLKVKSNEPSRPTFILLEEFSFKDPNGLVWTTPKEWEVDGATIPRAAWSFVGGPLSGNYLKASVIHDRYCDTKSRTAHDTHRNFYYGMRASGVSKKKADIMYLAVRTFGPSWKIIKTKISGGVLTQSNKYRLEEINTPSIEISDDDFRSLIRNIDAKGDEDYLDSVSDSIRSSYGYGEIQKQYPALANEEIMLAPQLDNLQEQILEMNELQGY